VVLGWGGWGGFWVFFFWLGFVFVEVGCGEGWGGGGGLLGRGGVGVLFVILGFFYFFVWGGGVGGGDFICGGGFFVVFFFCFFFGGVFCFFLCFSFWGGVFFLFFFFCYFFFFFSFFFVFFETDVVAKSKEYPVVRLFIFFQFSAALSFSANFKGRYGLGTPGVISCSHQEIVRPRQTLLIQRLQCPEFLPPSPRDLKLAHFLPFSPFKKSPWPCAMDDRVTTCFPVSRLFLLPHVFLISAATSRVSSFPCHGLGFLILPSCMVPSLLPFSRFVYGLFFIFDHPCHLFPNLQLFPLLQRTPSLKIPDTSSLASRLDPSLSRIRLDH